MRSAIPRRVVWDPTEPVATRPLVFRYAPFGNTTRTHRDSSASFDIVALNPFRFSSEHYDSELDLVYYNFRHYSPSLGRFLSRAPIEEQGGRGGLRFGAQFVRMCANDEVFH